MSATKPISPGDWVLWYGLWKVVEVKGECIPKQYSNPKDHYNYIKPHGHQIATLEPLNVKPEYQNWYQSDVKYHGGIPVKSLTRVNPISAEKRGYTKPSPTKTNEWRYRHCP